MFILVLPHKENKLHPIHRTIKSQDNFNKYQQHTKLWFAWKIVLLQYRKQLYSRCKPLRHGCDLLEKSYFCSIANNLLALFVGDFLVVICLKNRTFAVSQTTYNQRVQYHYRLWFAWKIVLLQYHKQHHLIYLIVTNCCDLLEKSYFCSITNSLSSNTLELTPVVICLKNRTFAVSQTAEIYERMAWRSCDLLEKSYFCSITNSYHEVGLGRALVVICLKNRTFAVSQTAMISYKLS